MKIHLLNYEKYIIDYLDGTLPPEFVDAMEEFLKQHPQVKAEVDGMRATNWPALPTIGYGDKQDLYRYTTMKRFTLLRSIAASLVLLLSIGGYYYFVFKPSAISEKPLATTKDFLPASPRPDAAVTPSPALVAKPNGTIPSSSTAIRKIKRQNIPSAPKSIDELAMVTEQPAVTVDPVETAPPLSIAAHIESTDYSSSPVVQNEIPTLSVPNVLPQVEFFALSGYTITESPTVTKISMQRSAEDYTDHFTPEAYTGMTNTGLSLREALIPEALSGLFSKNKMSTR